MTTICEICGKNDSSIIATKIREGKGIIRKCNNCNLVFQDIDMSKEELSQYYNEIYQNTNSLRKGVIQSPFEHFIDRYPTIKQTFENIGPYLRSDMDVLELGCGSGELMHMINPHVNSVRGIELNCEFVQFIKNTLNYEAYCGDINEMSLDKKYDLIISIMTLDHMPNPKESLLKMKSLLNKNGLIYIEVPNIDVALNKYLPRQMSDKYLEFFWHLAHYYYFSRDTFQLLLNSVGLSADIKCQHQYTLKNFLNWYFNGKPQENYYNATMGKKMFEGKSEFEEKMNNMIYIMDLEFQRILSETYSGDSLYCIARENDS